MARILFVVPPLTGHVNPTVAVGKALSEKGHTVAWTGCASKISPLLATGSKVYPVDEAQIAALSAGWMIQSQTAFGLESFKFFYEQFLIPLGHAMVPGVQLAVQEFKPDLMVCDQQALAGWVGAERAGVPWITSATTPAAVFNPLEQFPKVKEWMASQLSAFGDVFNLRQRERPDISPKLVLIFSLQELVGVQGGPLPMNYQFIGPSIRESNDAQEFPWSKIDKVKQKIYLSLGTVNAERSVKFYEKIKGAFAETELQLIVSAPPEMFGDIPANFIVQKNVPQLRILQLVDAVIFHGGQNTFSESLYNGLPLVVAPIKDDQPVIAEQVVRSGTGLRVHFDRVKSESLYQSVRRVLDEPSFRLAAAKYRQLLRKQGGAQRAAELIQSILTAKPA